MICWPHRSSALILSCFICHVIVSAELWGYASVPADRRFGQRTLWKWQQIHHTSRRSSTSSTNSMGIGSEPMHVPPYHFMQDQLNPSVRLGLNPNVQTSRSSQTRRLLWFTRFWFESPSAEGWSIAQFTQSTGALKLTFCSLPEGLLGVQTSPHVLDVITDCITDVTLLFPDCWLRAKNNLSIGCRSNGGSFRCCSL